MDFGSHVENFAISTEIGFYKINHSKNKRLNFGDQKLFNLLEIEEPF
jgi:hypothetical protein